MIDTSKSIEEGKQFLRDSWEEGADCPCCGQRVQLYRHKLNGSMAKSLIELFLLHLKSDDTYHHISKFEAWRDGYGGGQFAKVKYWGFAVDKTNSDDSKRTSGMWAITPKGKEFVRNQLSVPSHVLIFNKKSYGFDGEQVTIKDILDTKFNYMELMGEERELQGSLL